MINKINTEYKFTSELINDENTSPKSVIFMRYNIIKELMIDLPDSAIITGDNLIEDLETKDGLNRQRAVQLYCLSVLNWNEFLFVD